LVPAVMHCVPSQQPLHVSGPQLDEVHWLTRQLWVIEHVAQLPPSRPQATGLLPGWQAPWPSTQPLHPVVASQRFCWHDWPTAQGAQAAPASPQCWLVLPPRQKLLLSQQPLQLLESQPPSRGPEVPPSPATHVPLWQAPLAGQLLQVDAPAPQAKSWSPG
jgi:hypothetical protein